MRRRVALVSDLDAVAEELIGVFDGRHEDCELRVGEGRGRNVDVAAVPGESGAGRVGLGAPGLVCGDVLPLGVVVRGRGPVEVVAEVELPFAVDWHGAVADVFDGEDGRGMGSCGWLEGLDKESGVAQGQHEEGSRATHGRSLARRVYLGTLARLLVQGTFFDREECIRMKTAHFCLSLRQLGVGQSKVRGSALFDQANARLMMEW